MRDLKKLLQSKVKDCKNTSSIFNFEKYVLLKDAERILNKALTIPVISKLLPSDDAVFDKAANYIKRTGIINKPTLQDEVFRAYKYGCFWMRRQLK